MVAIEALYLTALMSAFVGLIALISVSRRDIIRSRMGGQLARVIMVAALVSLGSFFLYALSPHDVVRNVYGVYAESGSGLR